MLIDDVKRDQINARKDRNAELATLLTTFYSEAAIIGKNDGDRQTTDKEVQVVARKFIKNAREVIQNLDGNDPRSISALIEIGVVSEYLPQQLADTELQNIIMTIIEANTYSSMKDMGSVMKELKEKHDGQYDGKTASKLIK